MIFTADDTCTCMSIVVFLVKEMVNFIDLGTFLPYLEVACLVMLNWHSMLYVVLLVTSVVNIAVPHAPLGICTAYMVSSA